jgi:hypothetical protein
MIQVKEIKLRRGEGPPHECGVWHSFGSFFDADLKLKNWSYSAPEHGGYDKCDFRIVWEDGTEYDGRYDLKHFRVEAPNLGAHEGCFGQGRQDHESENPSSAARAGNRQRGNAASQGASSLIL